MYLKKNRCLKLKDSYGELLFVIVLLFKKNQKHACIFIFLLAED